MSNGIVRRLLPKRFNKLLERLDVEWLMLNNLPVHVLRKRDVAEDVDAAVGTRTVVHVEPETQRPVPWGEAFRRTLAPWAS